MFYQDYFLSTKMMINKIIPTFVTSHQRIFLNTLIQVQTHLLHCNTFLYNNLNMWLRLTEIILKYTLPVCDETERREYHCSKTDSTFFESNDLVEETFLIGSRFRATSAQTLHDVFGVGIVVVGIVIGVVVVVGVVGIVVAVVVFRPKSPFFITF